MYDSFQINLVSKTKWKLLIWLYYIFFVKSVLSVGINGKNDHSMCKLRMPASTLVQNNRKSTCFLYEKNLKSNDIAKISGKYERNKFMEDIKDGRFNLLAHNFTHYRNQVDQSQYWSSYYNRNKVHTSVPMTPNRHYKPQFQHTNMYYNNNYPVMKQYQQMGMSYYNPQVAPAIRPVYQDPNMSQVNVIYPTPQKSEPQASASGNAEFTQVPNNEYWTRKREIEKRRQTRYSTFKFYTEVTWWNDDEDDWPGINKIRLGEEYEGVINYYFTPFDALVLLVDKKVEGSVSLCDLPEEYSNSTIKDLFKLDHLIRFKLKEPLEFDVKGRPKFVICSANSQNRCKYSLRSKVRGTPIFFTNTMAVFKLEDNQNYSQVFMVNTGVYMTFPAQFKMKDLFTKGELVEMEVLRTPHEPKISGYSCRIPLDSEKGIELAKKYKMVSDMIPTVEERVNHELMEREFGYNDNNMSYRSFYKLPRETNNYFVNEYEYLLPCDSEVCSLRDFVRRIGANLKVIMSYISLKTKSIVNPETNVTKTMAKIILNFVKEKNIFQVDREQEEFEFSQFKEKNESIVDDRTPVVALLGGPGEGKSALFNVLCDTSSEVGSTFNFAKVKHEFPITLFDTPGSELLSPIRDNILKASDMALILISSESGVTKHTIELISKCKELNKPFLFVQTKFDLSSQRNIENIISKLASMGINLEQMGGEYQMISFSTVQDSETSKQSVFEGIILQSSLSDKNGSESDESSKADGYVLDSGKSKSQGFYSLLLVKRGSLKKGDNLVNGVTNVKVKSIRDSEGNLLKELNQSECGYVYGFDKDTTPDPGSRFQAFETEDESKRLIEINITHSTQDELSNLVKERMNESLEKLDQEETNENVKHIPVIVRSDVKAIADSIRVAVEKLKCTGISKTCRYKVLEANIGNLKQDDTEVLEEGGLVVACNSPISSRLENKLSKQGIKAVSGDDIAEVVKKAEEELPNYLGEKKLGRLVGTAQILKIFEASKKRKAAGCVVTFGRLEPFYDFRVMRDDKFLYYGKLSSLRRTTEEATEILETESCGITFQDFNDFKVGDVIEAYVD